MITAPELSWHAIEEAPPAQRGKRPGLYLLRPGYGSHPCDVGRYEDDGWWTQNREYALQPRQFIRLDPLPT